MQPWMVQPSSSSRNVVKMDCSHVHLRATIVVSSVSAHVLPQLPDRPSQTLCSASV